MSKSLKYVATGFRSDCYKLVEKFRLLDTMRYDDFAKIWREMKFPFIFFGHSTFDELVEFTEEALRISKDVWLKSEPLNDQACGLYILYGLYLKQPTDGLVKIRITSYDYDQIQRFHEVIRDESHHDVNYILSRMFMMGAFNYCMSEYPYGIEKAYRKYHENDRSAREVKKNPSYLKSLNSDVFNNLNETLKKYHVSKCMLVSPNSNTPPDLLKYADPEFATNLLSKFKNIMQSKEEKSMEVSDPESGKKSSEAEFKLPWWMIPVKNRLERESSSESEVESDIDCDISGVKSSTSGRNKLTVMNISLGLSGDEDSESLETVEETSNPRDMPIV